MLKPRKHANHDPLNRCPPHSEEAERGILGCCLIEPNKCLNACVERIKESIDIFYDLRYQTIYQAMLETIDHRKGLDVVSLYETLKGQGSIERVGGLEFLSILPDCTPSAANLPYYLEIAFEKYVLRKILQLSIETKERIYDFPGKANELLDGFEKDALSIRPRDSGRTIDTKELVREAISTIEEMHQRQGQVSGISTGFVDLDKMTDGLHDGEMFIVSAFPGFGKTALAMNIVEHVALDLGLPVGVFSLEMKAKQLMLRMLCSRARVNLRNVRDGFLAERDFPKLTGAAGKLAKSLIYFDDSRDISIYQLRAKARRMWQQHGIRLFVVDYLQLLSGEGGPRKPDSRQEEVASISYGIKGMAGELNVPVIALSQVNDDGKLKESRAIGQDADTVTMLDVKKEDRNGDDGSADCGATPMDLVIKKQRNGPTGMIRLTFLKSFTRFESAAKIMDDDN